MFNMAFTILEEGTAIIPLLFSVSELDHDALYEDIITEAK